MTCTLRDVLIRVIPGRDESSTCVALCEFPKSRGANVEPPKQRLYCKDTQEMDPQFEEAAFSLKGAFRTRSLSLRSLLKNLCGSHQRRSSIPHFLETPDIQTLTGTFSIDALQTLQSHIFLKDIIPTPSSLIRLRRLLDRSLRFWWRAAAWPGAISAATRSPFPEVFHEASLTKGCGVILEARMVVSALSRSSLLES